MGRGGGLLRIAVGAILLLALPVRSPGWINLHVVGIVLILWGVVGLALSSAGRVPRDGMRRWILPGQPRRSGPQRAGLAAGPSSSPSDPPTLADDVLGYEHDPPV
jgi:hypothetical protein